MKVMKLCYYAFWCHSVNEAFMRFSLTKICLRQSTMSSNSIIPCDFCATFGLIETRLLFYLNEPLSSISWIESFPSLFVEWFMAAAYARPFHFNTKDWFSSLQLPTTINTKALLCGAKPSKSMKSSRRENIFCFKS